ncbi:MAG TPA: thermonuclease family protein [Devosia sp.]|nr:thermonuclease family protein [Devosia sp.]
MAMSSISPAGAQECVDLVDGPTGRVVDVVDGDTLLLDNGLKVRLIGIQAPKLPLGRTDFMTWPLAEEARKALSDLALGQAVRVRHGGQRRDRYGRVLGHVFVGDEQVWAQGALVVAGLARVYSFSDNRRCLAPLYRLEAQARAQRAGIWNGIDFYAIRHADRPQQIARRVDWYELVEGRVLHAERVGRRVYLNFGPDWHTDFTVTIERAALNLFADRGLDPLTLQDALIRVRGWVELRDGPRIAVTHPEQIEVLALP